jgi:hypothetical protein
MQIGRVKRKSCVVDCIFPSNKQSILCCRLLDEAEGWHGRSLNGQLGEVR